MQFPAMMKLGRAVGANDISRVETLCADALRGDPRDWMALMVLADTYWRGNRPEDALKYALRGLELQPENSHALRIVADVYAKRDEHDLAYPYAKLFISADPPINPQATLVSGLLKPFGWIPKIRRIRANVEREDSSYSEWMTWSRDYVSWYESRGTSAP
jgi:tetratricopeptide (TPR) repeat protein